MIAMRCTLLVVMAFCAAFACASPVLAQTAEDESKIRAVIAEWYERVSHWEADAPDLLLAPRAIDGGPGFARIPYQPPGKRSASSYSGLMINNELASKAMKFDYDIDLLKMDPRFAKVLVWERGYFYAAAAQVTYENAASTMFLFEKMDDGRWLILAHEGTSIGIPATKKTNPMPDLHDEYYLRCGSACDPIADAKKAKEF